MLTSFRNKRKVNTIPITRKEFEEDLPGRFLASQNSATIRVNLPESSISSSTSGECAKPKPLTFHQFKNQTLKFLERKAPRCEQEDSNIKITKKSSESLHLTSSNDSIAFSKRKANSRKMYSTYLNSSKTCYNSNPDFLYQLPNSNDESSDHGELTYSFKNMLQVQQIEKHEQEKKKRLIKQQLLSFIQPLGDSSELDTERMQNSRNEYRSDDTEDGPGSSLVITRNETSSVRYESTFDKTGNVSIIKSAIESCVGRKEAGLMIEVLDCSQGQHFVILLEQDEFCGVYWQDEKHFLHRIFGYSGTPTTIQPSIITKRYAFFENRFCVLKSGAKFADAVSIA